MQFTGDDLVHVLVWLPGPPSLRVTVVIRTDCRGFISHYEIIHDTVLRSESEVSAPQDKSLESLYEGTQSGHRASEAPFVRTGAGVAQ